MSGVYGGIARSTSANEILSTITNGTTKNSISHRYGSKATIPRPLMPKRSVRGARLIGLARDHHGTGRIPREVDLLVPADRLGMARGIRLRDAHDLAGGEPDEVNRQVAEIGDVLNRAAHDVVGALRLRGRHEHLLGPNRRPDGRFRRGADA